MLFQNTELQTGLKRTVFLLISSPQEKLFSTESKYLLIYLNDRLKVIFSKPFNSLFHIYSVLLLKVCLEINSTT